MPENNSLASDGEKKSHRQMGLRIIVVIGIFSLAAIVIVGAFITGRGAEGSVEGFSKFQFQIFEASREKAVTKQVPANRALSDTVPQKLADRIRRSAPQLVGAYILWVDDGGALQNSWERRGLASLGVAIDTVTNTQDALELLQSGLAYDVIITDLDRPNDKGAACYPGSANRFVSAGCRLTQEAHRVCGDKPPPIIVYAGNLDEGAGQPAYTLGMTNRFDTLVEIVLDALERRPTSRQDLGAGNPCARTPVQSMDGVS